VTALRWAATSLVLLTVLAVQVRAGLERPLEGDFVAYALPAANLVENGRLAVPGVGTQCALDRYWRFNSPLVAAGPVPFFAAAGIDHTAYLVGVVAGVFVVSAAFLFLVRRAAPGVEWWVSGLVVAAFLLTRVALSESSNQRYTVVAYAAVACLFFPSREPGPAAWWRWALAGVLPLVHPALLIGSVVWVTAEAVAVARLRSVSRAGLAAFLVGVGLCALWYLDPEPLRTQFLPHLRSRGFEPFSGWDQPASRVASAPSWAVMAVIVVAVAVWVVAGPRGRVTGGGRVPVVLGVALALDSGGYMFYLSYFVLGLGPAVLRMWSGTAAQRPLVAVLAALGVANLLVEAKLGGFGWPRPPAPAGELEAFVREHTRPGDTIILGPPFTFQVLTPWADRRAPYVVPMPLYLADFDRDEYLRLLRGGTVYVGFPEYFEGVQRHYRPTSPPVFEHAVLTTVEFRGRPVLIARPRK
jgi:hypothetical protein